MDFSGGLQTPSHLPDYLWFFGMVALALLVSKTPFGRPFKWAETFYHEISHGLVCNLTAGDVARLELKFNGAGCCYTRGGWRIPTLLAGYLGAALWGGVLYVAGWALGESGATFWLKAELGVMALVTLLWVRDLQTLAIVLLISAVYGAGIYFEETRYMPIFLQFTGIYVMLNAIRAPLHLIDGEDIGDGAELAKIFVVLPEIFWVLLWFAFALAVLAFCMLLTLPGLADVVGCKASALVGCLGGAKGRLL